MAAWLIWLIAAALLAIAETTSLDFVLLMMAGGALAGAGIAALTLGLPFQLLAFAVVAIGLLVVVRPAAKRHLERTSHLSKTGVEALVGQTAVVIRAVDGEHGRVRIGGDEWSATSLDPREVLEIGRTVRVMEIRGATAIVWGEP